MITVMIVLLYFSVLLRIVIIAAPVLCVVLMAYQFGSVHAAPLTPAAPLLLSGDGSRLQEDRDRQHGACRRRTSHEETGLTAAGGYSPVLPPSGHRVAAPVTQRCSSPQRSRPAPHYHLSSSVNHVRPHTDLFVLLVDYRF